MPLPDPSSNLRCGLFEWAVTARYVDAESFYLHQGFRYHHDAVGCVKREAQDARDVGDAVVVTLYECLPKRVVVVLTEVTQPDPAWQDRINTKPDVSAAAQAGLGRRSDLSRYEDRLIRLLGLRHDMAG